jgi:signal peptidase
MSKRAKAPPDLADTKENSEDKSVEQTKGEKVVEVFKSVFIYLLSACIIVGAILFASSKSPNKSIFGYRYYTVLTPSMEPELSVGDLIFVKVSGMQDIQVGDIVTFNPSSDTGTYLTHRVTEIIEDYEGTGVTCFKTKGDANEDEDNFLIDEERLIGKESFSIPKMGYVIRFLQLKWYFVIPVVIMIFVLLELLRYYFADDEDDEQEVEEVLPGKKGGIGEQEVEN